MLPFHFPSLIRIYAQMLQPGRFRVRQVLGATLFILAVLILWLVVNTSRLLDHVLFGAFRTTPVSAPIYIMANPRSGTTFLHRLICLDEQFVNFKLWHTILPSVLLYRLVGLLATLDRLVGSPLGWLIGRFNHLLFQGWEGIHAAGMERTEEDEMLFVYMNLTPAAVLWFPFFREVPEFSFPDRLTPFWQRWVVSAYLGTLKRHLFAVGNGRTLVAKNVLAAGRIHTLLKAVPDLRIVYLVRHPYEAIPSALSMFTTTWPLLAPDTPMIGLETRGIADLLFDYYTIMLELQQELSAERMISVSYEDLIQSPRTVIEKIYAQFGLTISPQFSAALTAETARSQRYVSSHDYHLEQYGLSEDYIYNNLKPIFAAYGLKRHPGDDPGDTPEGTRETEASHPVGIVAVASAEG